MARRTLSGALALSAAALVMTPSLAQASPPGTKDVTAVLFEWNFASVAKECTNTLGPAGYGSVQVSPPAGYVAPRLGILADGTWFFFVQNPAS